MSDVFLSLLARHALTRPDDLAVADRVASLSWTELAEAVAKRAQELPTSGTDCPVAALHRPSDVHWLIDFLALRTNGVTVVCFPSAIPRASVVRQADGFSAHAVIGVDVDALPRTRPRAPWWREALLAHLTSGTTGQAMGVPRGEENLLDEARSVAKALGLTADHPILCGTPVAHSFASGLFLAALTVGAPTLVQPTFEPSSIVAMVERHRPAVLCGTPYVFRSLLRSPGVRDETLAHVRVPMVGGAPLHTGLAAEWTGRVGVPLVQEYGLSEGGIVTLNLDHSLRQATAVGTALPGVRLTITDDQYAPALLGEPGRVLVERPANPTLYVGGDGELLPIPTGAGDLAGAVDTGDIGFLDDAGLLHLTGRRKTLINVAGSKVSPRAVEAALLEHPQVADAVVVGCPDPVRGEAVAAVVEHASSDVTVQALAAHLRRRLSPYMVPRRWLITPTIPRTTSGKPDLRAIRAHFEEGDLAC